MESTEGNTLDNSLFSAGSFLYDQLILVMPQLTAVLACVMISYCLAKMTIKLMRGKSEATEDARFAHSGLYAAASVLIMPLALIITFSIAAKLISPTQDKNWLLWMLQAAAAILFVVRSLDLLLPKNGSRNVVLILLAPIIVLYFLGVLDNIISFLEGFKFAVGNISITVYDVLKTVIFGILLFWLGRVSSVKGQNMIRSHQSLDLRSKELFAKFFEIVLYTLIFILMLEIVGVDITALAIFGGALGVGIGLGLQAIASNFISGIIILIDRSISIGDHIELEDGQQGIIRELNMRSATIETFEGKDILVPNDKFITSTFVNWTHANTKQRYSLNLQVAYKTDLHFLFDLIRSTISKHPQVFSGDDVPVEERPDAEISGFGDSGVNILIEFWMDGIDDGKNKVGADIMLMLWDAFRENNIEIPFPQREVKILGTGDAQLLK